jgi:UDP-glucose 4-epimerase
MGQKTVLVTGGMGFVGSHIAARFIEAGYKVVTYGRTYRQVDCLNEKPGCWEQVLGSVQDWRLMLDTVHKHGVEGIVHAALPSVPVKAALGPDVGEMTRINFDCCCAILDICRTEGLKFVFVSSNAAYGYRPEGDPLLETDAAPQFGGASILDDYSATKAICDTLTQTYYAVHGVDAVSCRVSWVYGPGSPNLWYPQWFLTYALAGKPARLEHGGNFAIDYSYVKDCAEGVYLAYSVRPLPPLHRLFNICGPEKPSGREVVEVVKKVVPGAEIAIGPGQMELGLGRPAYHPLQAGPMLITRAQEDLGYKPHTLEEGLQETAEWYKKQPKIDLLPEPTF